MTVTIAGAGVVGCAVAYELARRGISVRVVDPRGIGRGATQASAGILAPAIEGRSPELLRLLARALAVYDAFMARLSADGGTPIEYERAGTLQVALDEREAAALAAASDRLSAMHIGHERLSGRDTARMEPGLTERVTAGLLVPDDGYVAVGPLLASLSKEAERLGVVFVTDRVVEVHGGVRSARAVTATQTFESDAVIVAAGCWQSDVVGGRLRPVPVRPIRGQIVRLRTGQRAAARVVWGRRCYLVPWRDGSVLVGATVEDVGFDERATLGGVRDMLNAAVELMPALEKAAFEEVRVGLRPMASDELPVIGASSTLPRVFHASGHYRNGVLLAPLTASLVADLVVDGRERDELAMTRPGRLGL